MTWRSGDRVHHKMYPSKLFEIVRLSTVQPVALVRDTESGEEWVTWLAFLTRYFESPLHQAVYEVLKDE